MQLGTSCNFRCLNFEMEIDRARFRLGAQVSSRLTGAPALGQTSTICLIICILRDEGASLGAPPIIYGNISVQKNKFLVQNK